MVQIVRLVLAGFVAVAGTLAVMWLTWAILGMALSPDGLREAHSQGCARGKCVSGGGLLATAAAAAYVFVLWRFRVLQWITGIK